MSVTNISLIDEADLSITLQFTATDDSIQTANFVPSKYGTWVLDVRGKTELYTLKNLLSVFDGGIRPSDELDLRAQLIGNNFTADNIKVIAFSQIGGKFNPTTEIVQFGTVNVVQDDDGSLRLADGLGDSSLMDKLHAAADLSIKAAKKHTQQVVV